MSASMSTQATLEQGGMWRHYLALTKPRIVALISFTAMTGALLARPGSPHWSVIALGTAGIALAAACAAAINQILDRNIDRTMMRTSRRPLPAGVLSMPRALTVVCTLGVLSMLVLGFGVNRLTAALTLVGVIGYAGIYTGWLKHHTSQNIVIGGAAGAIPPVIGWASVANHIDLNAWLLFLIIFVWTPPHFWSLAIARREDYARAGIPMLPVTHGVDYTRRQILSYTLLLIAVTLLPIATGLAGFLYLAAALPLNARFLVHVIRLRRCDDRSLAMQTFRFSITYLAGLFAALLLDHFLGLLLSTH